MRNEQKGPRVVPVALVVGFLVAGCSFYAPPFVFNNPYDANRDTASEIVRRTITVDGSSNDWGDVLPMKLDEQGDPDNPDIPTYSPQGIDLSAVLLARDSMYLYWRLDVWDAPPTADSSYHMHIQKAVDTGYVTLNAGYNSDGSTYTNLDYFDDAWNWLSTDSVPTGSIAVGQVIEGRVPLSIIADFVNEYVDFGADHYDDTVGQSTYDGIDGFELVL